MDGPGRAPEQGPPGWAELLERLYERARGGMVLGLDRVERVLDRLGAPQNAAPMIHVAGTNGKGSTGAFCAHMLSAGGQRVGLFTSPHLSCLTERFQIVERGVPQAISKLELASVFEAIESIAPSFEDLTFFEIVTVAGLVAFARAGVDAAVIEAGLGARLDATRLVDARVSVLTHVSVEHTRYLGETLEAIVREKVHVARPGRPFIVESGSAEVLAVATEHAKSIGAPLFVAGRDFDLRASEEGAVFSAPDRRVDRLSLSLRGAHQSRNAALAVRAVTLFEPGASDDSIREGLAQTRWPGRMQVIRRPGAPPVLLDGAHNPAAARQLVSSIRADPELSSAPLHFVVGVLSDKDSRPMIEAFAEPAKSVAFARLDTPRTREPGSLLEELAPEVPGQAFDDPWKAFLAAEAEARRTKGWIVACGSLYLLGALLPRLYPPSAG